MLTTAQIVVLETADIVHMSMTQVAAFETTDLAVMSGAQLDALISVSPIVLDLNGDGVRTLAAVQGVHFDLTGTGDGSRSAGSRRTTVCWCATSTTTARSATAASCLAPPPSWRAASAPATATARCTIWTATTAADAHFGELKSLAELGIVSMDLQAQNGTGVDNGNLLAMTSSYQTADGTTHQMADVWWSKDRTVGVSAHELLVVAPSTPLDGAATTGTSAAPSAPAAELVAAVDLAHQHAAAQALDELLRNQPLV